MKIQVYVGTVSETGPAISHLTGKKVLHDDSRLDVFEIEDGNADDLVIPRNEGWRVNEIR